MRESNKYINIYEAVKAGLLQSHLMFDYLPKDRADYVEGVTYRFLYKLFRINYGKAEHVCIHLKPKQKCVELDCPFYLHAKYVEPNKQRCFTHNMTMPCIDCEVLKEIVDIQAKHRTDNLNEKLLPDTKEPRKSFCNIIIDYLYASLKLKF